MQQYIQATAVLARGWNTLIAPVSGLSGSLRPREERLYFISTKRMHLKALTEECRDLVFTLRRVKGFFKELTVSKQQSQVEREHQIP